MKANFERQLDILPPEKLLYPITLIGLGGIGSYTAYVVRKMGFREFHIWDPDMVEMHNVPSQHFSVGDEGHSKVGAVKMQMALSLPADSLLVTTNQLLFTDTSSQLEGLVISGVDTMEARHSIWAGVRKARTLVPLYIDARIGVEWDDAESKVKGEWLEVFAVKPSSIEDCELYEEHLCSDEEAEPLRCTAQAVAYIGSLIAGFVGSTVRKWVTGEPYHRHFLYDALTSQILIANL
ncbi:MAG: hypothetical protein A3J54_03050 [Candidatus Ryanbacteria bacterium RIFCSPHIGHO2_02_FULL_45_13b]|uniref:THIF-type NAD/FAD binding fold domain-containing protein n=1 Tax=Candidatus Ryanbacteria bacterium RIFCSPHIGHO2_02_FULL_45_13b TaxID=1802117 RepID=A0A1G2G6S4_9BACT|nr:MAG: hypothetical protein A3J54_03050 [Candidatus Ryanbacteria bacterium RIFCSPHIGHO2_02_FULL_45_13b]